MKIVLIIVVGLIVVLAIAGVVMYTWMLKPLYEPGAVRAAKALRAPLTPPAQSPDPKFWTVESDIKLHHFTQGTGANVLVIHGGPGYPFTQPLAGLQPLTDRYRFHYYDQRGCGQSSRPIDTFAPSNYYENMQALDKALGLGAQIADIERIRQILGEDKLILAGHSFGGFIATLYAAEFPERVKALILIAPAEMLVMPPASGGLYEQVKPLLPNEMRASYADYMKRYFDFGKLFTHSEASLAAMNNEFIPYYQAALNSKGFSVPASNAPSAPSDNGGWMVQAMFMSMGQKHDYRAALKSVAAPALVIHGEQDLQPDQASRMYAELLPGAKFQVIQNASHFPFSEQPEAFARVVSEFLSQVR